MKQTLFFAIVALVLLPLSACAPPSAQKISVPLEIQAIQKRDFETTKRIAFGSIVSVLQDLGYIIGNADFETGIITGDSPTSDSTNVGANLAAALFIGYGATSSSASTTKVSAFVEEIVKGNISIRLNFVVNKTSSSAYGQASTAGTPILDENVYIEAFNKIENAIFVRS